MNKQTIIFWKRLDMKPKEDRNGEGSLVGERRDTPSYAAKSSKSSIFAWKI